MVLRILLAWLLVSPTGFSPSLIGFPTPFGYDLSIVRRSPYPTHISICGLASFAFARHYSQNLGWFLVLWVLRCFSSPRSPPEAMYLLQVSRFFTVSVSTFGNLRIYRLFAAPRSLSQLVTSFFGSWCQGIHLMLLFAWTSLLVLLNCLSFFLNKCFWFFFAVKRFHPFYVSSVRLNDLSSSFRKL